MEVKSILLLAKKSLKTAILVGLLLGAASFLILIATQKSFKSSLDFLVVQNQVGANVDYYAMSRSADYLTGIITESVHSEKFLAEVVATGKISSSFVNGNNSQRLQQWKNTLRVKKNSSVGILNVEVLAGSQNQAAEISSAVSEVLINKNSIFLGQGQNLEIRILSGPIIEKNPSVTKIVLVSLGGFIIGILLVLIFVIYREELFGQKNINVENTEREEEPEIYPLEEFSEKDIDTEENYLSEDSDYWKQKLDKLS